MKTAVLISGGSDSSCAALCLKRRGDRVTGITARLQPGSASGREDEYVRLAAEVCRRLEVPHMVLDLRRDFQDLVIEPFTRAYLAGETPNPCALCNRTIKLGALAERARLEGFDRIATGHYADLRLGGDGPLLTEPADPRRSQAYFLALVRPESLEGVEFPLARLRRSEVEAELESAGVPAASRPSQDLCFAAGASYRALVERSGEAASEGEVVDTSGKVLGRHRGHWAYTVGQRFGHRGRRLYVLKKEAHSNRIVIGERDEAVKTRVRLKDLNPFVSLERLSGRRVLFKYRYRTPAVAGRLEATGDGGLEMITTQPCFAPAPGQVGAIYAGVDLLAGGLIQSAD
jgi:tRNA-specific 2-thiouridylase